MKIFLATPMLRTAFETHFLGAIRQMRPGRALYCAGPYRVVRTATCGEPAATGQATSCWA
ncbi:hypothetical protein ACTMU2_05285 [Cupriavidus basilensis]